MVLIYIRHCRDESEDSATFTHDAKITKRGKRECQKATLDLVEKYGVPRTIVTSPFLRARQTSKIMKDIIKKTKGAKVKIIVDRSLGRFFTHEQRVKPEIRPETVTYNPIIDKSPREMIKRIKKHLRKVISKDYHKRSEVFWCISHGVIIKKLVEALGQKAPEQVEFLESFLITNKATIIESKSKVH